MAVSGLGLSLLCLQPSIAPTFSRKVRILSATHKALCPHMPPHSGTLVTHLIVMILQLLLDLPELKQQKSQV
jgi:hypothetical protein